MRQQIPRSILEQISSYVKSGPVVHHISPCSCHNPDSTIFGSLSSYSTINLIFYINDYAELFFINFDKDVKGAGYILHVI